jgi:hypothetical protein
MENFTALDLLNKLQGWPQSLEPLKTSIEQMIDDRALINRGTFFLGHRPWVAPENYTFMLYARLDDSLIALCEQRLGMDIPDFYKQFLSCLNGGFCYSLDLFGFPVSMQSALPLLSRKTLQCHSLISANTFWKDEYRISKTSFYFGSRHYTQRSNVGYFFHNNQIKSILKSGKTINTWSNFSDFLKSELQAALEYDSKHRSS